MNPTERLLKVAQKLQELRDKAKSELERQAIDGVAQELAAQGEVNLTTLTGMSIPMIRKGLVTP